MGVVITEIIACDNINYLRMYRMRSGKLARDAFLNGWLLDLDREEVFSSFWSSRWMFSMFSTMHW